MKGRIFTVVVFILIAGVACAQNQFAQAVQLLLQKPDYQSASAGIKVLDLDADETIFEWNAEKLLIPASTLKLVTTAAALELLGTDYRFKTSLAHSGEIDEQQVLHGNLVLIGGGDPTLGSAYFRQNDACSRFLDHWVEKIKAAGIGAVAGDLILDGSSYDTQKVPDTWIWGDIGNYYGAGTGAFAVYDNLFQITFRSSQEAGGPTHITGIYPKIDSLEITNEVLASDVPRDQAFVFGSPLDKKRVVRGTIPKGRQAFSIKASLPQPEQILARELFDRLAEAGVFITGNIRFSAPATDDLKIIHIHESVPLSEIIEVLNHESVNLFAEQLLRQIALEKMGCGSFQDGLEIIQDFWENSISAEPFFMADGSGLSHFNAISPGHFTALLRYTYRESSYKTDFLNSLPPAGNGTLAAFSKAHFAGNTLRAKSGSMTRVRCYTGFLKTDSGKTLAFALLFNHFGGGSYQLTREIENLLVVLKKSE